MELKDTDIQQIFGVIMGKIKRTIRNIMFFAAFFAGVWQLFGAGFLNDTIDERIELKLTPVIDVLDTTYYVSIETNEMVRGILKAHKKQNLIEEAEQAVNRRKLIDNTRRKLGKDKYKKKEK